MRTEARGQRSEVGWERRPVTARDRARSAWNMRKENRKHPIMRTHSKKRAFTLIELLAAVSILVVIVTIVGIIFAESDKAWTTGTQRVQKNMSGRAAINLITHDLQYVLVDDLITMNVGFDRNSPTSDSYDFVNSELTFASLNNDPTESSDPERAVREYFYYVRPTTDYRYQLMRGYCSGSILSASDDHCYKNIEWCLDDDDFDGISRSLISAQVVCENVSAFAVYVRDPSISIFDESLPPNMLREYYSYSNAPPPYLDICLELLSEKAAKQIADIESISPPLPDEDDIVEDILEKNVTRFTARVYLQNWDRRGSPE